MSMGPNGVEKATCLNALAQNVVEDVAHEVDQGASDQAVSSVVSPNGRAMT
jgi:hypothetical protein